MNGYVLTILVVSFIGGIFNTLIPDGSIKKYVKYVVSLVCVISLVSPITALVLNATNIKSNISNYFDKIIVDEKINATNSLILSTTKEKISEGIKKTTIEKYKFDENEVFVSVEFNEENSSAISIKEICVILTGKSSWTDCEAVEKYLNNLIGANITVKRR